jgi:hypothetical protein
MLTSLLSLNKNKAVSHLTVERRTRGALEKCLERDAEGGAPDDPTRVEFELV